MGYKFNPFTGNLDEVGAGGGATSPGGSTTQVQFNDGGAFGGDADLTWNKTTNVLGITGDVNLSDGGTYTTTLQTITPTANRTISLPDATGTVALVGGSSGQLVYNNAGVNAGASTLTYDGSILTTSGRFINSYNATASAPAKAFTGTWFTGGTGTTTKPQVLIEPTGATSTAWSTSGTGLGVNAASGFAGNLLDLQVNGSNRFSVGTAGNLSISSSGAVVPLSISHSFNSDTISLVRGGGTGRSISISETGFGPCIDILKTTSANVSNTNSVGLSFTGNFAHSGSFGAGRGLDITATNNTATSGILHGATINATANSSGATAVGLSVTVASTSGTKYAALFNGGFVGVGTTTPSSLLHLADAGNITVGTTTGTKIGTSTTQKLGFFDKVPVVQPTAVADATDAATAITQLNALLARMRDLGLIAT